MEEVGSRRRLSLLLKDEVFVPRAGLGFFFFFFSFWGEKIYDGFVKGELLLAVQSPTIQFRRPVFPAPAQKSWMVPIRRSAGEDAVASIESLRAWHCPTMPAARPVEALVGAALLTTSSTAENPPLHSYCGTSEIQHRPDGRVFRA